MTLLEAIFAEAIRLAGAGGVGLLTVVALLIVSAVVLVLGRKLQGMKLPAPDPEPAPEPPAQWNTDPSQGAVVVPGPPGGSDEPIQGG